MKSIFKLSIILFALGFLSSTTFAQEVKNETKQQLKKNNWVDADGDGICDNVVTAAKNSKNKHKKMNKGFHKGNGQGIETGNINGMCDGSGLRPQDGTGFGKKHGGRTGDGTGNVDSGLKGSGRRGGK